MELKAAIKALEYFDEKVSLSITTDSNYVKDGSKILILGKINFISCNKKPLPHPISGILEFPSS